MVQTAVYDRAIPQRQGHPSGLFRLLGTMVAHSIAQVGVGIPYFSPACFWYMAKGEERAVEYVSTADVGADVASLITKVGMTRIDHQVAAFAYF